MILITHKFREVTAFADDVTVLRRGALVETAEVAATTPQYLGQAMVGEGRVVQLPLTRDVRDPGEVHLAINSLQVMGDRGALAVQDFALQVRRFEIVGVAGVSGNGQRELMQSLTGQRARQAGTVTVAGTPYAASRRQNRRLKVRALPEEPLQNACVADLSVAHNMGLRQFDEAPFATPAATGGWVRWGRLRQRARGWIADYGVKTQGERAPIRTLSGGNVQRAVLARELAGDAALLQVSNPVFGLDFAAVAEIHGRLMAARNRGAAVLLVSEDLDELLTLADRIVVMSEGRIVFEVPAHQADRRELGAYMGGKCHGGAHTRPPAATQAATQPATQPAAAAA